MKVLVVGAGAREHALAIALMARDGCAVVCAPGNAGIALDVPTRPLDANDPVFMGAMKTENLSSCIVCQPIDDKGNLVCPYADSQGTP